MLKATKANDKFRRKLHSVIEHVMKRIRRKVPGAADGEEKNKHSYLTDKTEVQKML